MNFDNFQQKVLNPITNRYIRVGSNSYYQVLSQGYLYDSALKIFRK